MENFMTVWMKHKVRDVITADDDNADVYAAGTALLATIAAMSALWAIGM
jgi:hypothetical protein